MPAGTATLKVTGRFDAATAAAVRRFQHEAGLQPSTASSGPQTRPQLLALMRLRRATWYGPGLYGNRTACGKRLRRSTLGVAHTHAALRHPGDLLPRRALRDGPVIDRGPFRHGVAWDLTAAAARQLGMAATRAPALDPLIRGPAADVLPGAAPAYDGVGRLAAVRARSLKTSVSFCKLPYPQ